MQCTHTVCVLHSGEMMITCVRKPIGLFYKVVVEITFIELSVVVYTLYNVQCIVLHGKGISKIEAQTNGLNRMQKLQCTHSSPTSIKGERDCHRFASTKFGLAVFKSKCQHINPLFKSNDAHTLHILA